MRRPAARRAKPSPPAGYTVAIRRKRTASLKIGRAASLKTEHVDACVFYGRSHSAPCIGPTGDGVDQFPTDSRVGPIIHFVLRRKSKFVHIFCRPSSATEIWRLVNVRAARRNEKKSPIAGPRRTIWRLRRPVPRGVSPTSDTSPVGSPIKKLSDFVHNLECREVNVQGKCTAKELDAAKYRVGSAAGR